MEEGEEIEEEEDDISKVGGMLDKIFSKVSVTPIKKGTPKKNEDELEEIATNEEIAKIASNLSEAELKITKCLLSP